MTAGWTRPTGIHDLLRGNTLLDLTVANNDTPLDFTTLLGFPDFDFTHDILGIARHLNRKTGKIDGVFLPRCAKIDFSAKDLKAI